jgi:2-oxoisovalerate dehydrogenase E2 component (dihydrolipoyl transacylase)
MTAVRSKTGVQTVTLPDLGEGLTESDLVEWLVAPGDAVELNQVVAEVETAKALVQLPSPCAGVVAELLVEPGTTVPVGTALMTITMAESEAPSAVETPTAPTEPKTPNEPAAPPAVERTSVLVGYGPPVPASARPRRRGRSAAWVAAHATNTAALVREPGAAAGAAPTPAASPASRPVINPLVRKLANDLGVHLERVSGTGVDGAITRGTCSGRSRAAAPQQPGRTRRRPCALRAIRRAARRAPCRARRRLPCRPPCRPTPASP